MNASSVSSATLADLHQRLAARAAAADSSREILIQLRRTRAASRVRVRVMVAHARGQWWAASLPVEVCR